MGAYIVDKLHIDLLVRLALEGPDEDIPASLDSVWDCPATTEDPDAIGQMLVDACVASVRYRYPDPPDDLPGPVEHYYLEPFHYARPEHRLTVAEGLKAIDGYVSQSCELPGWPESGAADLCQELRSALIFRVKGYSEAPWTWEARDARHSRQYPP